MGSVCVSLWDPCTTGASVSCRVRASRDTPERGEVTLASRASPTSLAEGPQLVPLDAPGLQENVPLIALTQALLSTWVTPAIMSQLSFWQHWRIFGNTSRTWEQREADKQTVRDCTGTQEQTSAPPPPRHPRPWPRARSPRLVETEQPLEVLQIENRESVNMSLSSQ